MRPPAVEASWDECNVIAKSELVAFDQLRQYEEAKEVVALAKIRI